ncbi:hypothetical protein Poli38472_001255 [Pythium oligandrum]|uniref:Uncharacterized protein n=1 Tax=Pythium oligandrum TaxID=41045 RepID=A0A8K1CT61_PYTOL|nr:hypothetical protein Poli38472_001255 [Pythium oligandrum]|eukprot:TMW69099.1 hypothetical protein Poli38472_001255 [Pythium oligandrum]
MVKLLTPFAALALALFAPNAADADSTVTLPHWVGPAVGKPIDTACYRKTYLTKQCPPGYNFDKIATCWAQCPIEYPVECGMECIPQNQDCTKEILSKVGSVVNVALNVATSGVFGELAKAGKGVQQGVKCGQQLFNAANKVVSYIDEVEKSKANVDTTQDQLLYLLSKSDLAVVDLPIAVATCIGVPVPANLDQAKDIVDMVKGLLQQIIGKKASGENVLDANTFVALAGNTTAGSSVSDLTPEDEEYLKKLVASGVTCGSKIKDVIDRIVLAVQDLKKQDAKSAVDVVRFAVMNSDLILKDLPDAANSCLGENAPEGFQSRDDIIKTVHVIVDRIVDASSQNGNPISVEDYAFTITNMGLDAISLFDPTGIAAMAKEFVQPICGPTVFIGEIDDGPADKALGLKTVEKAFRNSTGEWKKQGDGLVKITFQSVDDQDVSVNIMSGGQKVTEVKVGKGKTVEWSHALSDLQGKTMYLDRWRPGFLGIPGTGGGSLLTWVPADADGSLTLNVKINPTSFSDHALRK